MEKIKSILNSLLEGINYIPDVNKADTIEECLNDIIGQNNIKHVPYKFDDVDDINDLIYKIKQIIEVDDEKTFRNLIYMTWDSSYNLFTSED